MTIPSGAIFTSLALYLPKVLLWTDEVTACLWSYLPAGPGGPSGGRRDSCVSSLAPSTVADVQWGLGAYLWNE